jgi:hypothetical protein
LLNKTFGAGAHWIGLAMRRRYCLNG